MQQIDVLICTIDRGIERVETMLLPPQQGVRYVVSMQYTDAKLLALIPQTLRQRSDVLVTTLAGRGLSRNRNHALSLAEAPWLLIADDDEQFRPSAFRDILAQTAQIGGIDIALLRLNRPDGAPLKFYPKTSAPMPLRQAQRLGYSPASVEMLLRRDALQGLRFDERFGLGSDRLASGEEDVFIAAAERKGLNVCLLPLTIGTTAAETTGDRFLTDPRVQMSKGAAFSAIYGLPSALWRTLKHGAHALIFQRKNPMKIIRNMLRGIRYERKTR